MSNYSKYNAHSEVDAAFAVRVWKKQVGYCNVENQ